MQFQDQITNSVRSSSEQSDGDFRVAKDGKKNFRSTIEPIDKFQKHLNNMHYQSPSDRTDEDENRISSFGNTQNKVGSIISGANSSMNPLSAHDKRSFRDADKNRNMA